LPTASFYTGFANFVVSESHSTVNQRQRSYNAFVTSVDVWCGWV